MTDEQQSVPTMLVYHGNNENDRIASAQMVQIGRGILIRFGKGFTPDEIAFMNIALGQYAHEEPIHHVGVKPSEAQVAPAQMPVARPAGQPQKRPTQQK